jgi:predicted acetylornithine/succinylornithine family transaminase
MSASVQSPVSAAEARRALLGVYAPPEALFVAGEGPWLIDEFGRRYLDFTAGIGVNALGHGAPEFKAAVLEALQSGLVHTSNLFRTAPAEALAVELVEATFPSRVFFCNSGAESGEAALKISRKWAKRVGGPAKHGVVAFHGSFHGRLFGTLAATDRPGYREPFEPLMPGVRFLNVGDLDALDAALDAERVSSLILEPVQGEGGIRPVPHDFMRAVRELCTERKVALIFDEVQCGMGRSGRLFAHEWAGVRPDLLMIAKPLAGGLPMGALVVAEPLAAVMAVGDHGTTFGGGPFVATVARAVLRTVSDPEFLAGVQGRGRILQRALEALAARSPRVKAVRGIGLIWGVEVDGPAADVVTRARERSGLLLVAAGKDVVRVLPPLNTAPEVLTDGVQMLGDALQ